MVLRTTVAIVLVCGGITAVAQEPERPPGTYVSGQVFSATSNAPLRRVRIDVARGTWRAEPALTDNEGRFFVDIDGAGPFSVSATKGGYLVVKTTVQHADLGRPLLMRLPRGAVITGSAIDENGRPVRGARVLAKRLGRAVDGFPEQSVTETDDRGEYRLAGLPPGQYKLEGGIAITSSVQVEGTMVAVTEPGDQIGGVQLTVPESRTEAGALRTLLVQGGAPVSARQPSPRLPGGVSGRVLNAANRPVHGASVRLSGSAIDHSASTDASGGFSFAGLPAGRYTLDATTAWGKWSYGQDGTGRIGIPVVVADRMEQALDIVLPRYLAIEGFITDEYGEPVQGARVQALQVEYTAGRLVATPAGSERLTDDQGSYRLPGLTAGTYLISASLDGVFTDSSGARVAYAPVYYPGTPQIATASTIDLRTDSALNLVFAPVALTQITGKARDVEGPLVGGTVRLVENRGAGMVSAIPRTVPLQPDGSFIIRNVPPGDYVLHVRGDGPGRTGMFGTEMVSVGSDPIDLVVQTSHGITIEGTIVLEGRPETVACRAQPVRTGQVVTLSCSGSPSIGLGVVPVALDDHARTEATMVFGWTSREFFATGLFGRQVFALRSAPGDDWYIKSFTMNGTDIADSGFDFGATPGTITDAEIVFSRNSASISGRRADEQADRAGYFVLVFPSSRSALLPSSRRVKVTRSATDGSFHIGGLPPGDYLVAAVSYVQGGEWQNPALLDRLAPRAHRITLSEGEHENVSLRLIER